jgi:hypothetical protein
MPPAGCTPRLRQRHAGVFRRKDRITHDGLDLRRHWQVGEHDPENVALEYPVRLSEFG